MVIELRDGSILIPKTICEALDAVEEYMGTDMRQYLEGWIEDGEADTQPEEMADTILAELRDIESQVVLKQTGSVLQKIGVLKTLLERKMKDGKTTV